MTSVHLAVIVTHTLDFWRSGERIFHLLTGVDKRVVREETFGSLLIPRVSVGRRLAEVHSLFDIRWHPLTTLKVGV